MYNKKTKRVKIIDFGSALRFSQKVSKFNKQVGTLAYLSPEQTGRLDRAVDYRSDYYSLGVSLYQLLCGKKPFISETNDPMELIHSHVAIEPPPLPSRIPKVLCDIVAKLMSKDADDRYVSSAGLLYDLNRCLTYLKDDTIEPFTIATHDYMDKFIIPKRLYGRENETKTLIDTYKRVTSSGKGELLLVSGYSGIGKSSLITQVQTCMRNGYYIFGKFNQVSKNISYSAIADAFQALLRQILGESEERVQMWRERILKAVGVSGQLVIKMIPELEKLIGEQPPVQLNPQESSARFKIVLRSFVSTFTQKEHPLVLFLDDLQCMFYFSKLTT